MGSTAQWQRAQWLASSNVYVEHAVCCQYCEAAFEQVTLVLTHKAAHDPEAAVDYPKLDKLASMPVVRRGFLQEHNQCPMCPLTIVLQSSILL